MPRVLIVDGHPGAVAAFEGLPDWEIFAASTRDGPFEPDRICDPRSVGIVVVDSRRSVDSGIDLSDVATPASPSTGQQVPFHLPSGRHWTREFVENLRDAVICFIGSECSGNDFKEFYLPGPLFETPQLSPLVRPRLAVAEGQHAFSPFLAEFRSDFGPTYEYAYNDVWAQEPVERPQPVFVNVDGQWVAFFSKVQCQQWGLAGIVGSSNETLVIPWIGDVSRRNAAIMYLLTKVLPQIRRTPFSDDFASARVQELRGERLQILERHAEELAAADAEIDRALGELRPYMPIPKTFGPTLASIVKEALQEVWGFSVTDLDELAEETGDTRGADYLVEFEGESLFVEVRGSANRCAREKDVLRLGEHAETHEADHGTGKKLLLFNHQVNTRPADRDPAFGGTVPDKAEAMNVGLVSALMFYRAIEMTVTSVNVVCKGLAILVSSN